MTQSRSSGGKSVLLTLGVVALPVAYVLTIYLDQGVWLGAGVRAALVTAVIAVVIVGLAVLVLRDRMRGALVGACLIGMLVFWSIPALVLLFVLVAATIAVDAVLAGRTGRMQPRDVRVLHGALGAFGLLLLAVTLVQFGVRGQIVAFASPTATAAPSAEAPDIWVILLDGYPRADVLRDHWGFDNSEFLSELERRRFFVADDSRSNYNTTKLTLPSMLNMALLRDIEPYLGHAKPDQAPVAERVRSMQENRAFSILREHGYRIVSISAGYTHEEIRTADSFIDAGTADVVELFVLGRSIFGELSRLIAPDLGERQIQSRIEANLRALEDLAQESGSQPRFVFAHVPGPHPPLVYSQRDRPFVPFDDIFDYPVDLYGEELLRASYGENIEHLNGLVLETLDELVEAVGDRSVIILMSDHGSRTHGHVDRLSPPDAAEQFSTLFAARTPDGEALYEDDVVTANILTTLFNHYLRTDLPLLPTVLESLDGTLYDPATYEVLEGPT